MNALGLEAFNQDLRKCEGTISDTIINFMHVVDT